MAVRASRLPFVRFSSAGSSGQSGPTPSSGGKGGSLPLASGNSTATLAMVLGILLLVLAFGCTCIGPALGIVAVVLGMKAKKEFKLNPIQTGEGMATAGIVTGRIVVVWGFIWTVITPLLYGLARMVGLSDV